MNELELPSKTVREMVKDVLDRLLPWIERLPDAPISQLDGSRKLAASMRTGWPERGTPWRGLLATLDRALQVSLNTTSPGYLAYIPGGGLPHAAIADLYADLANRFTGLWMPAPGFVAMEIEVIRWFCEMIGYGAEAGGALTTGGSLANLEAVVAARRKLLPEDFLDGVVYLTEHTHHSIRKAAYVAGFSARNLHVLPVDARHRLPPDALRQAIHEDRARGLRPFLVVAAAGSTALGAVDDLEALADVAEEQGLWLHVDAAYGGFFALTDHGKATLGGISRADSVALDPHKGLFLPYGTGCVIVKRLEDLRRAHAVGSSYLPPPQTDPDAWDFADLGPELSRDYRGLRVWLPLRLHGFSVFRAALDEKLALARQAAEATRKLPTVRLVSEPVLSLFAFRAEPAGEADLDAVNRRWLARVNQRQRVFLTGATVFDPASGGQIFVLRVCILSFRTHRERIASLVEDLAAALADPT
jgi:aromatic-L-amino-acid decarboxylase